MGSSGRPIASLRVIGPDVKAMPRFGWAALPNPVAPHNCSWCNEELVERRGLTLCAICDRVDAMPFVPNRAA